MGYMRNHTIIVTGWDEIAIAAIHEIASAIFPWVSPMSPVVINCARSFFVPPDGSKEGWDESVEGDKQRAQFIAELKKANATPEDMLDWVEVQYGDDNNESRVCDAGDFVPYEE